MTADIPVLYYHFIQKPPKEARIKGLYTSPVHFAWQLKMLRRCGYRFITFEQLLHKDYNPADKNLILTFDDGCESVYLNAFGLLKKYSAKAVFYIVAAEVGKRDLRWEQNEHNLPLHMVTGAQLREMADYGIEIGSHLCHHVHLTGLTDEAQGDELRQSKQILENMLQKPLVSVAYPFGSYNDVSVQQAEKAGYYFAVTTLAGSNAGVHPLRLHRYAVKGYALRHYWYFLKLLMKLKNNSHETASA